MRLLVLPADVHLRPREEEREEREGREEDREPGAGVHDRGVRLKPDPSVMPRRRWGQASA